MKLLNTKIIFALLLMFGLAACSSDDDAGPSLSPEEVIPGTWELISISSNAESNFEGFFIGSTIVESNGRDFNGQITFTENPTEYVSNFGYTADIKTEYIVNGVLVSSETDVLVIDQQQSSGSWSINDNDKLVGLDINAPDGEFEAEEWEYDVEIISANQITLTGKQQFTHTEQGITSVTNAEVEATLMRVN